MKLEQIAHDLTTAIFSDLAKKELRDNKETSLTSVYIKHYNMVLTTLVNRENEILSIDQIQKKQT